MRRDKITEQRIIEMLKNHDECGVTELHRQYGPLMRYIVAPILQNPQDQEECLSEITMRVWDKIENFHAERGSWTGWLTAVSRNTALNFARKNKDS